MNQRRLVTSNLVRIYRVIALWFWATMTVCVAITMTVVVANTDPAVSLWLVVAGSAAKYWLGVVGILLVSMHLRQFVTNGVTRRDFLTGAAAFGVLAVALFSLVVPIGHGVEQALLSIVGPLPGQYPTTSFGTAVREVGYTAPASLAFLVTGAAATAGFYRFGVWRGLALLPLALIPLAVAESLIGVGEQGVLEVRFVPFPAAVLSTLAATALGALLTQRELRAVAIRRGAA